MRCADGMALFFSARVKNIAVNEGEDDTFSPVIFFQSEEKQKKGGTQVDNRITLGEMKRGIDTLIRNGISEGSAVMWAVNVEEGDDYQEEYGAVPGSVLLGLEYIQNGELVRGTAALAPDKISKLMN